MTQIPLAMDPALIAVNKFTLNNMLKKQTECQTKCCIRSRSPLPGGNRYDVSSMPGETHTVFLFFCGPAQASLLHCETPTAAGATKSQ